MSLSFKDDSDSDAIVIDRDDVSNYNPEQILPEPSEEIQKLRAWLKPTPYDHESGEYRKHLASHAPGTGDWLTSSPTFTDWLKGDKHGLLWVKGIPGSGKSVLVSKIIKDLSASNPGVPVLYFFFRQIIDANHESAALLRDWLDQVLLYSPPLQKRLREYIDKHRSLSSLSMDDLWMDLRFALSKLHGKVFCVADALDEMDRGNENFLRTLAEIGSWNPGKVKVLVTSRPVPTIEASLRTAKYAEIRLQESMVDVDIAAYVNQGLATSKVSPGDQRLIQEAIPGRANGLFLYAKLAMDAFLEPDANIKEVLNSLPEDMNAMYANLLREHSHRSGVADDIQRLILQWVTHATRPLRLLEMAELINMTYTSGAHGDLRAMKDLVRAACGPLLEILPDETVCVIHHSFTEYLKGTTRSSDDTGYSLLKLGETHANLGAACLRYLQSGCLDQTKGEEAPKRGFYVPGMLKQDNASVELKLKYPFIAYAMNNWHVHIAKSTNAAHDQTDVNAALDEFFGNANRVSFWLQISSSSREDKGPGVTPLHIAAKTGLTAYAKHLLSSPGVSVDAVDAVGRTPLWWAASRGMTDIVQLLIAAGANPDQDETVNGLKPLHEASKNNHPEVVKALLSAGVDPLTKKTRRDAADWCGSSGTPKEITPLMSACHEAIHSALAWAAESGRNNIVTKILKHPRFKINRKVNGWTPLFRACLAVNFETIQLLLNEGADPSIRCYPDDGRGGVYIGSRLSSDDDSDRSGITALYALVKDTAHLEATKDPSKLRSVLKLFIEKGADIHQQTLQGETLLHAARHHHHWVRLLLDEGVDANLANTEGHTPLFLAQSTQVVALLVEKGKADINQLALSTGTTPLLCLLNTYCTQSVIKLIEYGPDFTVTDKKGNGPLHIALKSSYCSGDVIKALLRAGADPNMRNHSGETLLDVMQLENDKVTGIMDLLLDAGADINARGRAGATLLFRVASVNPTFSNKLTHQDIKALLSRGALKENRDFKGRTILHETIRSHPGVAHMPSPTNPLGSRFDFFLNLGLDVHAQDYEGNNLLHELSWHPMNTYDAGVVVPIWEQVLNLGLDVNQPNNRGRTPLHNLSCKAGGGHGFWRKKLPIDLVISHMKNINAQDRDGIAPLHMAATVSDHYTRRLLDAGADPSIKTNEGLTPLHLAARARQSNIVGILLDALRNVDSKRLNATEDTAAQGGYVWLADPPIDPVTGVNATDEKGRTPLYYACRTGRPEIVSILIQAGASARVANLRDAVTGFEAEQDLWLSGSPHEPGNGNAGGLTIGDISRPTDGNQDFSNKRFHSFNDTTRLEEIIEMLLDHGADLSPPRFFGLLKNDGHIAATALGCRDYTLKCLSEANQRRPLNASAKSTEYQKSLGTFDECLVKHRREAVLQALREYEGIKDGEANEELFFSRLRRREYEAMEELFNLGVDFLAQHMHGGNTNLGFLVQQGFASLVRRIGSLETESKFNKGVWHAAGDKTRPGLGHNTTWIQGETSQNGEARRPFLLQAVSQELPVFDVVRILVESFAVDVNELYVAPNSAFNASSDGALHCLARGHHWWHVAQALPYLISRGANLELKNSNGQTPLHIALNNNHQAGPFHKDAARLLILAGADVNAVDGLGKTLLSYAGDNINAISQLIECGAAVKADALFAAIEHRQTDMLDALLSAGVNPNMRPENDTEKPFGPARGLMWDKMDLPDCEWYPLHQAASKFGKHDYNGKKFYKTAVKIIDILLSHGADPFATFSRCKTDKCYHQRFRLHMGRLEWDDDGEEDSMEVWMASNKPDASPEPEKHETVTLLHRLLVDGDIVQPFLTLPNIDANYRDARGRTLLHAACYSDHGPDLAVNLFPEDRSDDTQPADPSLFEHLISLGADPEARDHDGRNAMHHLLRLRKEYYNRMAPIANSLAYMTTHHSSIMNQRDKDGKTPMYLAADRVVYDKNTAAAELLLQAGADPLIPDNDGNTVLHVSSRMLWISAMRPLFEELVKRGCDVNARNSKGETPLFSYYARYDWTHEKLASMYLEKVAQDEEGGFAALEAAGADFQARNGAAQSLLHVAAKGPVAMFQALLARGLDPMLEDNEGKTALDVAAACRNAGVLGLFKRA
ncbi:hypothetical protein EsH8_IV_000345 [Colletotrichum jinshuiense]